LAPLGEVANRAQEIAAGNLKLEALEIHSNDEIGQLGERFNEMQEVLVRIIIDNAAALNELAASVTAVTQNAEQGRGFAVVAEEVRKLADRTSKATQEIDGKIGRIQEETREVVDVMQDGMKEVEMESKRAGRSVQALEEIGGSIEKVNQLMQQLYASILEQSTTSDEIVGSTNEMNQLVQQVTNAMNEQSQAVDVVSNASEEMQGLASGVTQSMQEQSATAGQVAGTMEEVKGMSQESQQAMQKMEKATDGLTQQAEDLKALAAGFQTAS
jgi:methyl-accepting chemotaxis protein